MGHRQQMSKEQRMAWDSMQYQRRKESNKGHNYAYWNEKFDAMIETGGWDTHKFTNHRGVVRDYTSSETQAKEAVEQYRNTGFYSRIVCGMCQSVQREKTYTVIFKKK